MFTYDSNWKKANDIMIKIAQEVTASFKKSAKNELVNMGEKYFIRPDDVEDKTYIKLTDNWIDIRLRYVFNPFQRRLIKHTINEKLLEALIRKAI